MDTGFDHFFMHIFFQFFQTIRIERKKTELDARIIEMVKIRFNVIMTRNHFPIRFIREEKYTKMLNTIGAWIVWAMISRLN